MITYIEIKNFKSWSESGAVKLAPLTGFFGTNSSGKSSLLQMLLLLKQTIGRDQILFFGFEGSPVNLGNFREMVHRHNLDASLELEFGCKLQEPYQMDFSMRDGHQSKSKLDGFIFRTVVSEEAGEPVVDLLFYYANDVRKRIIWDKYGILDGHSRFINATRLEDVDIKNCYGIPILEDESDNKITWHQNLLRQFSCAFETLFSCVYYLGPTRVNSRRFYNWEGRHPMHTGPWGNEVIDALLSARVRNLKTTVYETEETPIEQRISYWLQEMDLAHSFSLNWMEFQDSKTYEVRIQKTPSSPQVTLVDMGYGLSQFLPVLVLCYYAPEESTLILEQPGIHLHPKVQSQLADLLIEVVTQRKLQILVESHSEHLLTRLQRRISEKKISQDDTALYFCRNNDGASTIEQLDVTEFGEIKNWPENFFGDVMGDMFAMTDEQAKRMPDQNTED